MNQGNFLARISEGILAQDRRMLAKGISLIESIRQQDLVHGQKLLETLLPHTGHSYRIGITGVPGVGKSTFIEELGLYLIAQGHKPAVLAVDPTSERSGGSILGDKTRMIELSRQSQAFIRPSPSGGTLGGVARKTRETILLCEAAGFDIILVETVGIGQSETTVASMVDFLAVLMLPNAGDELQCLKRGIMEMGDAFFVNKADGEQVQMAQLTVSQLNNVLHFLSPKFPDWHPQAQTCSSIAKTGIKAAWDSCQKFFENKERIQKQRKLQVRDWVYSLVQEMLMNRFYQHSKIQIALPKIEHDIISNQKSPTSAALELLEIFQS